MINSPITTLFYQPPRPVKGSASLVISGLGHVVVCSWLALGLAYAPRISTRLSGQHYSVRVLDVAPTHPLAQQPDELNSTQSPSRQAGGASSASESYIASQLAQVIHQDQTLVQPDAPPDVVLLHKTPIPTIAVWSPEVAPIKPVIVTPPQTASEQNARPSTSPPNRESNPADIEISSTRFETTLPVPSPSTTSPIVVHGPSPTKQAPETASQPSDQPTPARVVSISDRQVHDGPVVIPLANATAPPSISQSLSSGHAEKVPDQTNGISPGKQPGTIPGPKAETAQNHTPDSGTARAPTANQPATPKTGTDVLAASGTTSGTAQKTDAGPNLANDPSTSHIVLPKDGQFGFVVVGSSLAEKYPETVSIWSGRMAYTVYLHIGKGKNWVLQYSLPAAAQNSGTANIRPEAPWPYDIVQPHFDQDDFTSDALMVHGFVDPAGHLERLALVFPDDFPKAKFLLSVLQQWQFRPARQDGQAAAVEVLLIIPDQAE